MADFQDEKEPVKKRERTQIMTLKEVAKYLGLHPISIYRLIKTSDIPAMKIGGQWRFKKEVLDEWLAKQSNSK
ncbi:MAG: helix-turn-helix domain-containing protein [Candidatus Omnitrophica bacterium]|nr:helix-turn-helix domain-containing protein [Candidatus Omnitrophota bacterium]